MECASLDRPAPMAADDESQQARHRAQMFEEDPSVTQMSQIAVLEHPHPHDAARSRRASVVVFDDPMSRALLERVEIFARSDVTVLVTGETGTGKEVVARHVHARSARRERPFVSVNCAALTDSLIESELFGHERGSFTGAISSRAGWFETANGGTLFLDEIGDLPLAAQVRILRVLQEREVVRVGSRQPLSIDVRLIAATNVNLDEAVNAGHFRQDLYYRLKVASVKLPPLRERRQDILPLARHFVKLYGGRLRIADARLSSDAEALLTSYTWPGNIRELENVVHHALLVSRDGLVRHEDLHLHATTVPERSPAQNLDRLRGVLVELFERNPPDLHRLIEDTVFRSAYDFCESNQVRAARLLGVSRNILRARLKAQGLLHRPSDSEPVSAEQVLDGLTY